MVKKEVDPNSVEAILKGKQGYEVIWEEREEVSADGMETTKEPINFWTAPQNNQGSGTPQPKKSVHHHIHKHQHSIEFIVGFLAFMILVYLFFVNPPLFILAGSIVLLTIFIFLFLKKQQRAYVDQMQQNVVYLKIKNPILTGFEFALGIGMFGMLALIVILLVFGVLFYIAAQGIWNFLAPYIPI